MPKQERGAFNLIERGDKTREKEISSEEKTETIKKNKVKELFSKMDTPQIKEFFGNKEFELLYDLILPELSDKEGEKNRRRIDKNHRL